MIVIHLGFIFENISAY